MSQLKILTFSDKPLNDQNYLVKSCKDHGLELEVISPDSPWQVNAQKLKLLFDYLKDVDDHTILLVVDAFDVYINAASKKITDCFLSFDAEIVFSAEANFYFRNPELRSSYFNKYPQSPTAYRFLNSGTFIGYGSAIKKMITDIIQSNQLNAKDMNSFIPVRSDQYLYGKHFVDMSLRKSTDYNIKLDYRHELMEVTGGRMRAFDLPYLFYMHAYNAYKVERFLMKLVKLHGYMDALTDVRYDSKTGEFRNRVTKTSPLIIHLPGSWANFDTVLNQVLSGRRKFHFLRILALPIALLAYVVSLVIPARLKL